MKYSLFVLMVAFVLGGCSSTPKVLMKNCKQIHDDYYECEEIPQKVRERGGRF